MKSYLLKSILIFIILTIHIFAFKGEVIKESGLYENRDWKKSEKPLIVLKVGDTVEVLQILEGKYFVKHYSGKKGWCLKTIIKKVSEKLPLKKISISSEDILGDLGDIDAEYIFETDNSNSSNPIMSSNTVKNLLLPKVKTKNSNSQQPSQIIMYKSHSSVYNNFHKKDGLEKVKQEQQKFKNEMINNNNSNIISTFEQVARPLSFIKTEDNAVSTFSIDVDNASYSQVRSYINQGIFPPAEVVRTEELINYFNYNYPKPKGKEPISINTEVGKAPWNENNFLLKIGLKAKEIPKDKIPKSNLVFLIDVSGSMDSPNKLPLLKRVFKLLVKQLGDKSKVSIVVYSGNAGLVLKPTSGKNTNRIIEAIDNLNAGGSTAGGQGIMLAYKLARENFIKGGNNRVILATDGDFNVGVSSDDELVKLIKERRDDGIYLTIMGFGMGNYKDTKMEELSNKGNGNYYYIDNFLEAKKTLETEFMGTMYTVAKDVKIQVEFNKDNVKSYRLIGYDNRMLNREDFNNDKIDAGEMGAGHTVTALYEIIPAENFESRYSSNKKFSDELLYLKLRYKEPDKDKSKLIEHIVKKSDETDSNSIDFNFAASVAAFSEKLMNRDISIFGYGDIEKLALKSKGKDIYGYRAEFINLVRQVHDLKGSTNFMGYRSKNSIIEILNRELFYELNMKELKKKPIKISSNLDSDNYIEFIINAKGEVSNIKVNGKFLSKISKIIENQLIKVIFPETPYGINKVKVPIEEI